MAISNIWVFAQGAPSSSGGVAPTSTTLELLTTARS